MTEAVEAKRKAPSGERGLATRAAIAVGLPGLVLALAGCESPSDDSAQRINEISQVGEVSPGQGSTVKDAEPSTEMTPDSDPNCRKVDRIVGDGTGNFDYMTREPCSSISGTAGDKPQELVMTR